MQLNDLKKSMSTLEQVLAKTSPNIEINVSVSETAQSKILRKYRQELIVCLVLAAIFAFAAIVDINPLSFPRYLKMYLVAVLVIGAAWYGWMYRKLRGMDVASLAPARLFAQTATLRLHMISGELFLHIAMVVFFTLVLPEAWDYNRFSFWAVIIGLVAVIVYDIFHYYPKYICLFRDLNSIK